MPPSQSNLPESIVLQLKSLQNIKLTIERLEGLLSKAREEHERLETQIAIYRASVAPIRRITKEILTLIFEEYVSDQPTHIRCLLLVCRHWHQLVTETPRLWTYIRLNFSLENLTSYDSRTATRRYIELCCERSKGRLLHITMDFRNIPSKHSFLQRRVGYLYYGNSRRNEACGLNSAVYDTLFGDLFEVLKVVVSSKKRWQSLNIAFETYDGEKAFLKIWPRLAGNAPNLTEFAAEGYRPIDSLGDYEWDWLKATPLTKLAIQDWQFLANVASGKPLQSLEIPVEKISQLKTLKLFTKLRSLTLDPIDWKESGVLGSLKLSFPLLTHLCMKGSLPTGALDIWDTPNLQDLHLRRYLWDPSYGFPNLSPVNITWELVVDEVYHVIPKLQDIRIFFNKYPGIKTLVMYKCYAKKALGLLADIRRRNQGLKDLRYITFIDDRNWRQRKDKGTPIEGETFTVYTDIGKTRKELLDSVP